MGEGWKRACEAAKDTRTYCDHEYDLANELFGMVRCWNCNKAVPTLTARDYMDVKAEKRVAELEKGGNDGNRV